MLKSNKPIYIDALPFAQPHKSGVGHITEGVAVALGELLGRQENGDRKIYLVVSLGKSKYVKQHETEVVRIKTIPLPARIIHALNKFNILPPMDIFLGRGNYIFPNYRNWRLFASRSFTYIHDLSYYRFKEYVEPKNYSYISKNIPIWIRRADVVITASEYTKDEIEKYLKVPKDKVFVVPHGVDIKQYKKIPSTEYMKVIKSYGVDYDNYILHVGNIEPRKNIKGLVQAYVSLPTKLKEKHPLLFIGGDGWLNDEETEAIKKATSLGNRIIRPSKYVEDDDLPAFYSAASIVAMPSFYEGYGMPPLQAMSVGTPTIVSNNSSLAEIFGEVSTIVDPKDYMSIAKGLEESLGMSAVKRRQYEKNALGLVKGRSWENTAKTLLSLVERFGI